MKNALAIAGPGSKYQLADAAPAGFCAGVWHGMICPITFVVSLFNPSVKVYEVHNRGRWYEFGFLLGATAALSGARYTQISAG
jgi:hypothetical protein